MINYPNNSKYNNNTNITSNENKFTFQANNKRGQLLEKLIDNSNDYYQRQKIALIYKKPTPIKIVKTKQIKGQFTKRHQITEAYFEKKSTTDYSGIYKGKYIDFEAKQTKYKSFNLRSNLHEHQIEHLIEVENLGGLSFIFIQFYAVDKIFLIRFSEISNYINEKNSLIPLAFFEENAYLIKISQNPPLNYLTYIDQEIAKGER